MPNHPLFWAILGVPSKCARDIVIVVFEPKYSVNDGYRFVGVCLFWVIDCD